ncbi:hypothetical protein HK101_002383 [Irineochytrium annulatum]|nr:hypothetical protein HK101_002383 [Irineochytrium annulatum]
MRTPFAALLIGLLAAVAVVVAADVSLDAAIEEAKAVADSVGRPSKTINPDGVLETLTDDNFDELTKASDWFIMFMAPWCGHCKRMMPAFEELAQSKQGMMNIATVDSTVNPDLVNKFGIKGFPTLKFVRGPKKVVDYSGGRTVVDMQTFLKQYLGPPFEVIGAGEIEDFIQTKGLALGYVYDPNNAPDKHLKRFLQVCRALRGDIAVFVSPDVASYKLLQLEPGTPRTILFKEGGLERLPFAGSMDLSLPATRARMAEWTLENLSSLTHEMDRVTTDDVMNSGDVVVVLITNNMDTRFKEQMKTLRKIAAAWRKKSSEHERGVSFAWIDALEHEAYVKRAFKASNNNLPHFVIADPAHEMLYVSGADGKPLVFQEKPALKAIEGVLKGDIEGQTTRDFWVLLDEYFNWFMKKLMIILNPVYFVIALIIGMTFFLYHIITTPEEPLDPKEVMKKIEIKHAATKKGDKKKN